MRRPISFLSLTATLALATASLLSAQPAEAGSGGVRLNFGGPLGTFIARPTPGYGGGSGSISHHKSKPKAIYKAKQRSAPKQQRPVVQQASHGPSKARSGDKPAHRAVRATPVVAHTEMLDTAIDTAVTVTGTRSLVNGVLPVSETIRTIGVEETVTAFDAPDSVAADLIPDSSNKTQDEPTESKVRDCKKFIPAVGVTITVGCDD